METLSFKTASEFRTWLEKNFTREEGMWLRLFRKNSGVESVNYDQALDEALCFGWIDGQVKKDAEQSWLQRFTPRRKRSLWSKRNIENVKRLIKEGKMMPSGQKEIDAASTDGRWEKAYDPQGDFTLPQDFLLELGKDKKSEAFFNKLNKANKFAIYWKLYTAKRPETREKWMKKFLEMMSQEQKLY